MFLAQFFAAAAPRGASALQRIADCFAVNYLGAIFMDTRLRATAQFGLAMPFEFAFAGEDRPGAKGFDTEFMEDVMNLVAVSRLRRPAIGHWVAVITLLFLAVVLVAPRARAQDDDAAKILKAMSDYIGSQKSISAAFDSDIEIITPEIQKIQFTSSGQILLVRPDKLRASRTGGYADVELVFDGKTFTIFGKNLNAFAQLDAPGSTDQLIDRLRNEYSVEAPGADLLLSGVYEALMTDVLDAKHIGRGVIDGVECEHLAFRNQDTDWQLWVEVGPRPIPHKYVITSKTLAAAPQYTLRIKDWKTDVPTGADEFAFKPPTDAKKIEFKSLSDIDELPSGVVGGGKK